MSVRDRTIADRVLVALRKNGAVITAEALRVKLQEAEAGGLSKPEDVVRHVLAGIEVHPPQRRTLRTRG